MPSAALQHVITDPYLTVAFLQAGGRVALNPEGTGPLCGSQLVRGQKPPRRCVGLQDLQGDRRMPESQDSVSLE